MAVKGNGAVTDAYYKVAGQNSLDNVLTLNGDVNIITPKSRERGFLALGAFGGTVNVNVKTETDAGGKVKVTGASDHKVNLVGISMHRKMMEMEIIHTISVMVPLIWG